MSDLDCDIDCCDLCDCCEDDCLDCDCCSCDCSCCSFNCFGDGGDTTWIFFGSSSSTNQNSGSSCFCCCFGGGGGVGSPPHRTVKAATEPKPNPKPKKISRLKRILMFWKTYKENDQEQKPAEMQLNDMPRPRTYPPEWAPRSYYCEFVPRTTEHMEKDNRKPQEDK